MFLVLITDDSSKTVSMQVRIRSVPVKLKLVQVSLMVIQVTLLETEDRPWILGPCWEPPPNPWDECGRDKKEASGVCIQETHTLGQGNEIMSEYDGLFFSNPKVLLVYKVFSCFIQNSCAYGWRNTTFEGNLGEVFLFPVFLGVRLKLTIFLCFTKKCRWF